MDAFLDHLQHLPAAVYGTLGTLAQLVIIIVATIVALWVASAVVRGVIAALLDRETSEGTAQELSAIEVAKRRATLQSLVGAVVRTVIAIIGFLMALDALRLNVAPAIAGLGVLGVALGLGAQSLVKDYLAGAYILIENQYAKGDVVRIAGVSGTVEDFTLRRTTLRGQDGTLHSVPNGLITVASNLTRIWARITVDLRVPFGTDIERAGAMIDAAGKAMADDPAWARRLLEAPRFERVESLGPGLTLRIVGSVRAADRWAAAGELRRRLAEAFAGAGIELQG
ncbi:MAG TPA: mechanosensitive ion channel family protein [Candidatus Limnocylindrales bacterium]|jgi:small conductance mechanosensitive channel|nr:mechanosensitive ion channel family protein [Candidatus Limnocylindrales bacterium]